MMTVSEQLNDYITLLKIRRTGRRRETTIVGGLFLVSFILTIGLGLLDRLSGRAVFLDTAIFVAIGIGFLMAWVRLEIVSETIDLLNNLQWVISEKLKYKGPDKRSGSSLSR